VPLRRSPTLRGLPLVAALLAGCGGAASQPSREAPTAAPAPRIASATADAPVVVELYQSQGCSSCPPANANVNAIADRPEVLALSLGVTYWDQLGWTDSFAKPQYTARQWDYARAAGRAQVATPQVVINGGRTTVVGSNAAQLTAAIQAAGSPRGGPAITATPDAVALAAGKGAASTVWLVRYDPQVRQVAVNAGENGGRTLPHRDVVRQLVRLGDWSGPAARFALPPAGEAGLRTAVLVQQGKGGPITAARRI
jgi:hypothetical protein